MDPITLGVLAGGVGAQAVGGLIKGRKEREGIKNARATLNTQLDAIRNIPDPELRAVELQKFQNVYNFTPKEMKAIMLDPSAFESMEQDPLAMEAQREALRQLQEYSDPSLTEADEALIADSQLAAEAEARSMRQAALANMARRGLSGSGQELAAQLSASQGAADRAAGDRRAAIANAQNRALQAIAKSGQLSGQMRGQQTAEQQAIARAKDAINAFNVRNQIDTQRYNVEAANQAANQKAMLDQSIANKNVGIANQNLNAPNIIAQQQFDNRLTKERAASGVVGDIANTQRAMGASHGKEVGALGGLLGNAAFVYGGHRMRNQNKNKDDNSFSLGDNYFGHG